MKPGRLPCLVRGDLDGFFGLLIDNLVNLMLIVTLCSGLLGMSAALVFGRILPGAALSILLGNLFYAWQARRVARRPESHFGLHPDDGRLRGDWILEREGRSDGPQPSRSWNMIRIVQGVAHVTDYD